MKKLKQTLEIFEKEGKKYDYVNRVLASFAEFYNYDYTISALLEKGELWQKEGEIIRQDGLLGRVRAYKERENTEYPIKMYYNEVTFNEKQQNEFGYLICGSKSITDLADLISLAIRLLEAFGIHNLKAKFQITSKEKENIYRYLDCYDIEYVEENIKTEYFKEAVFEIVKADRDGNEFSLIKGGEIENKIYAFHGIIETLILVANEYGNIKEETKKLDIIVSYNTEKEKEYALYLTQELRLNGFKTEINTLNLNLEQIKNQFTVRYEIKLEEEALKRDVIIVTDLDTKEKEEIKEMDLINHLDMNF